MQSQLEKERSTLRMNLITTDRPDSAQLVDLHVYVVPKFIWKDRQNLAENEAMDQAISAGFVHVPQNLSIHELRHSIVNVCGQESDFPKEFVYLRSVGRCLAKVKPQQETELRVKNYRPPLTFAPEIYLLEGRHDDEHSFTPILSPSHLFRESPMGRSPPPLTMIRQRSWIKPLTVAAPLFLERAKQNSLDGPSGTSISNRSIGTNTPSARELSKLREEQERLRLRQMELARLRREMEEEQQRQKSDTNHRVDNDEEATLAATRIQATYRGYRDRREFKKRRAAAVEIERLQKEARELARHKAEEEYVEEQQAHDVVQLDKQLQDTKKQRAELEAAREAITKRMQQLHAEIAIHRKEARDTWKQKYLIEKKKTAALEERSRTLSKIQPDMQSQVEQAKMRLNTSIKLRNQAEDECRLLRQKLQQIRATMDTLPKDDEVEKDPQQISLDITLQY